MKKLFKPKIWIKNVLLIDEEFLNKHGLKGLILDLDNTLSMHGSPAAEAGVEEWLADMRRLGVKMTLVSNNTAKRVAPLARELGLSFIPFGCKPLPFGINKAAKSLGLPKSSIAVVGDQIFTDVTGGNISGIKTILVEPFHMENKLMFKLKRKIESAVFKRDYSK
ncbi:MAG: YqeG family HAD IIIA-type phosphatase, partial [Oscillospiraceae bacterium]|nr:YqeG family HAD IIIA-type phosphatase [Oscillospiraceae bacterium]